MHPFNGPLLVVKSEIRLTLEDGVAEDVQAMGEMNHDYGLVHIQGLFDNVSRIYGIESNQLADREARDPRRITCVISRWPSWE